MQGVLENQALILKKTTSLKQDNDKIQARMEELHRLVEQTAEMLHRIHTLNFSNMADNSHVAFTCDLVYNRTDTLVGTLSTSPQDMLIQDPNYANAKHNVRFGLYTPHTRFTLF